MQDTTKYPRRCSRWVKCSVNECPLMPPEVREHLRTVSEDPEKTCLENLRHRQEIVEQARQDGVDLGDGLTRQEQKAVETGKTTVEAIIARRDEIEKREAVKVAAMNASRWGKKGTPVEGTPSGDSQEPPEHDPSTESLSEDLHTTH